MDVDGVVRWCRYHVWLNVWLGKWVGNVNEWRCCGCNGVESERKGHTILPISPIHPIVLVTTHTFPLTFAHFPFISMDYGPSLRSQHRHLLTSPPHTLSNTIPMPTTIPPSTSSLFYVSLFSFVLFLFVKLCVVCIDKKRCMCG